jgi:hypothetical protein
VAAAFPPVGEPTGEGPELTPEVTDGRATMFEGMDVAARMTDPIPSSTQIPQITVAAHPNIGSRAKQNKVTTTTTIVRTIGIAGIGS